VGRVLRHFRHDGAELYGTDYNPDLIAWCRSNLRFARFEENSLEGPLPYADQSFRFAYAFSVFTHLTEAQAIYWTQELARVLSPGGLLFFSVQGEEYLKHYWWLYRRHLEGSGQHEILHDLVEKYGIEHLERHTPLNAAETERFQRGDVVVLAEEVAGTNSCAAFHPSSYVTEILSRGYEVLEHLPGGAGGTSFHDAWLFKRVA
jgi:SAM-dependent methyltransferase